VAKHLCRMLLTSCIAAVALAGGGVAAAAPPAVPPGPGEPGYCGAHTSPWNCWSDVSPARPGEVAFINETLSTPWQASQPTATGCSKLRGVANRWRRIAKSVVQFLAEDPG
jgi:hypothetical protein